MAEDTRTNELIALDAAVRDAKTAAGLNPDSAYPPNQFIEHLPNEWHAPFWTRQIDRWIAGQGAVE